MAGSASITAGQHSGPLAELLTSIMAPAEAPAEKTCEELAKMSKADRTAYHRARLAANEQAGDAKETLSKAEKRAVARDKQDLDRKNKENVAQELGAAEETLAELKLQGLSEEQAQMLLTEMTKADAATGDDDEDSDTEDTLLGDVRDWMAARDEAPTDSESLRDFNLKVRFQGHVETTTPDHLAAILHVLSSQIAGIFDPSVPPQRPSDVAERAGPMLRQWTYLVSELYKRCDVLDVTDVLVASVDDGLADVPVPELAKRQKSIVLVLPEHAKNIVLVGVLMAIRDEFEFIADEDILAGCHQLDSESKVVLKFIDFLQKEVDGSDDGDSDSEAETSFAIAN